jgi:predicted flap endonuclease-1-like 5' DNA nuclease
VIWHLIEVWALLLAAFALGGALGTVLYMALAVSPLADAQIAAADAIADRVDAVRDTFRRRRDTGGLYRAHRDAPPPAYVMPLPASEPMPEPEVAHDGPVPDGVEPYWPVPDDIGATAPFDEGAAVAVAEAEPWLEDDEDWAPDEEDARWPGYDEWPVESEEAPHVAIAQPEPEMPDMQAGDADDGDGGDVDGPDAPAEAMATALPPHADDADPDAALDAADSAGLAAADAALSEAVMFADDAIDADDPVEAGDELLVAAADGGAGAESPPGTLSVPDGVAATVDDTVANDAVDDADGAEVETVQESADAAPRAVAAAGTVVALTPAIAEAGDGAPAPNRDTNGAPASDVGEASSVVALPAAETAADPAPRSAPTRRVPTPATAVDPGTRPLALPGPRNGVPDNLRSIRGIGQKNEDLLHSLGIFHFGQIAAWTPAEARWVANQLAFPERLERDNWIGQAIALATGDGTAAREKEPAESPVAA